MRTSSGCEGKGRHYYFSRSLKSRGQGEKQRSRVMGKFADRVVHSPASQLSRPVLNLEKLGALDRILCFNHATENLAIWSLVIIEPGAHFPFTAADSPSTAVRALTRISFRSQRLMLLESSRPSAVSLPLRVGLCSDIRASSTVFRIR